MTKKRDKWEKRRVILDHQRAITSPSRERRLVIFFFFILMTRSGGGTRGCRLACIVGSHRERVLRTEMKLLDGESESRRSGAGEH